MEILMLIGMCLGIYYVLFSDPEDVYNDRELLRRYGTKDKNKIREQREERNKNGAASINKDERSSLHKSTSTKSLDKLCK